MKRREFLMGSAAAAAARGMWGQSPDAAKLSRIGVMSLCFELYPQEPRESGRSETDA